MPQRNVNAKVAGDKLLIEIDISPAAIEAAPLSSSGKRKLVASTSGFANYGPVELSLNVTA